MMDIFEATKKGDYDRVEQLLDTDLDLDTKDKFGCTALHYASFYGHTSVVMLILETNINQQNNNLTDFF